MLYCQLACLYKCCIKFIVLCSDLYCACVYINVNSYCLHAAAFSIQMCLKSHM